MLYYLIKKCYFTNYCE